MLQVSAVLTLIWLHFRCMCRLCCLWSCSCAQEHRLEWEARNHLDFTHLARVVNYQSKLLAECLRLFFQTGSNSFLLSERMPPVSSAKPLQRNAECVMHEDCRLLSASALSKRRRDGTFESLRGKTGWIYAFHLSPANAAGELKLKLLQSFVTSLNSLLWFNP